MKLEGSNSDFTLGTFFNPKNNAYEFSWIQEYQKNGNIESIHQFYADGNKFLTIEADVTSNRVLKVKNYAVSDSKFSQARLGGGSFDKCMNIAMDACSQDAACTILCGITFISCVAATMIACW